MENSYVINHLGEKRKNYFNAATPPTIQSANFIFETVGDFRDAIANELGCNIYTRGNNPTVAILREKLAALEKAEDSLVFGSGTAAIAAGIIGNVQAGDHIVSVALPYSWTHKLLTKFLPRFGVATTFVDARSIDNIKNAFQKNTRLLVLESPNSLTFELQDLAACAQLAKEYNITTMVDNSYCSPIYQNPITLGIDLVVHSVSKYINGHSDLVAGALCGSKEMIEKIFASEFMNLGAIVSPHEANLILRGLRTLPIRIEKSSESCIKIVEWLAQHPKVEQVHYPFHSSFPQYDLAKQQMRGAGGLCSIHLKAENIGEVEKFCNALNCFLMAVSWGGHESLVLPIAGFYNVPNRTQPELPWNLVRLYIGLEDADWLIADLKQALEVVA